MVWAKVSLGEETLVGLVCQLTAGHLSVCHRFGNYRFKLVLKWSLQFNIFVDKNKFTRFIRSLAFEIRIQRGYQVVLNYFIFVGFFFKYFFGY